MTESRYTAAAIAPPPTIRAQLEHLAGQHAAAARAGLLRMALVVAVVYGAIALLDLAFGIIEPVHWVVLVLGSAILLVPMALIHRRDAQENAPAQAAQAERLRADLAAGRVLRHTLLRDSRHAFVPHEHGVIHVCPADATRTLVLDLSSIADDPRHDHWYAKGLIDRARWTWFTTSDGAVRLGFEAEGAAVLRREATDLDGDDLLEFLGLPADGEAVGRPWAEVEDFLRRAPVTNRAPRR